MAADEPVIAQVGPAELIADVGAEDLVEIELARADEGHEGAVVGRSLMIAGCLTWPGIFRMFGPARE